MSYVAVFDQRRAGYGFFAMGTWVERASTIRGFRMTWFHLSQSQGPITCLDRLWPCEIPPLCRALRRDLRNPRLRYGVYNHIIHA